MQTEISQQPFVESTLNIKLNILFLFAHSCSLEKESNQDPCEISQQPMDGNEIKISMVCRG